MEQDTAEARVARLGWRRKALYSLLPTVLVLGLIEGAARVAEQMLPPPRMDLGLGFNPEVPFFLPRPGAPEQRAGLVTESEFPARKAPDTFRIFMLGGSSVHFLQGHFRALGKELTDLFSDHLKQVEVINAGACSYGSQRVLVIAREALEYEPDLFVLYSGHNEFEDKKQLEIASLGLMPLQRVLVHVAACRLLWGSRRAYQLRIFEEEKNLAVLRDPYFESPEAWDAAMTAAVLPERMRAFGNNLRVIARMCRERNVPLVIGTVPSNHWDPALPKAAADKYYAETAPLREAGQLAEYEGAVRTLIATNVRRQSSDVENGIIADVAKELGLPLADVRKAVREAEPHGIAGETLFTDTCHLNDRGNDVWIATYKPLVVAQIERALGTGRSAAQK